MTAHATLNGTIIDVGDTTCDQRGFDWGTQSGVYPYSWTENGSFGNGIFSHQITGLDLNKMYYFRAKAHNTRGWGYGSEKSFLTPAPAITRFITQMVRAITSTVPTGKVVRSDLVIHGVVV